MRLSFAWIPLALGALTLTAGCSGDDGEAQASGTGGGSTATGGSASTGTGGGNDGTAGAPVARADFPDAFARVICTGLAACCSEAEIPYDDAQCRALNRDAAEEQLATLEDLQTRFNPEKAGACLAAYPAYLSKCGYTSTADLIALMQGCDGFTDGLVELGGSCTMPEECADGASCSRKSSTENGTCRQKLRGASGDACSMSCEWDGIVCWAGGNDDVNATTACHREDGLRCLDNVCQPLGQAGAPCWSEDCADGFYCKFESIPGVCAAQVALGASCEEDDGACAGDTFCDVEGTGNCVAPREAGGACTKNRQCASHTCDEASGKCLMNAATVNDCAGIPD